MTTNPNRRPEPTQPRSQTPAQAVIASLALPAARPASPQPASPLPLTGLHRLPRDTSMLYDIGRADASGRVASNDIIGALHWQPGGKLDVILTPRTIVIRTASDGLHRVPRRPCIILPSHARRPHGIKPGDQVLIAAAPDHGLGQAPPCALSSTGAPTLGPLGMSRSEYVADGVDVLAI